MRPTRSKWAAWAVPVVVALITFAAFAPALRAGFVTWDDNRNFLDNAAYRGLAWPQLSWMWTSFHMGHYVPLTWMTLGLDYELWGMDAAGYHLQNLLLHCANAVLVYFLARRVITLGGSSDDSAHTDAAAALAALLFAVHPLRVESVAWITERRDMLSLLFCLASVLSFLRSVVPNERRRVWYVVSLAAFTAALLSKATSISVPAVLLVLNVYPLRRLGGTSGWMGGATRQVYLELLPFAVLAAAAAVLSIVALEPPAQLSLGAKIAVSAYSLTFYIWKTILPSGLAPLYEMPKAVNPWATRFVVSYLIVVLTSACAWALRRKFPGATTAWIVFLLLLLPMLGAVQNGPQIAADRYTYHAAPALAILAAAAASQWGRVPFALRVGFAGAVLAVLGVLTWRQTLVWHDSERLWRRVLAVDSTSSIAQIAMGDVLIAKNQLDEAADHYQRGVELDPTFAIGFNNLGVILARQGKFAEARARYARALELRPTYADAHNNLGIALSEQGDYPAAVAHFREAISLDSTAADPEVNLGNALVRQAKPDLAVAHYARAAALRPSDANAYLNWGAALAQIGKFGEAIEQFRRVLAIEPDNIDARAYLDRAERMRR